MSNFSRRLRSRNIKKNAPRNSRKSRNRTLQPYAGLNRALMPTRQVHTFDTEQLNVGYNTLSGTVWSFQFSPTFINEGTEENQRAQCDLVDIHSVRVFCNFCQVINYAAAYRVIGVRISDLFDYNVSAPLVDCIFPTPVNTSNFLTVAPLTKYYQTYPFKIIFDNTFVIDTNGYVSQAYTLKRFRFPKTLCMYKPQNPHGEIHRGGFLFVLLTDATPASSYTYMNISSSTKFTLRN